jgi:hypothetical protein
MDNKMPLPPLDSLNDFISSVYCNSDWRLSIRIIFILGNDDISALSEMTEIMKIAGLCSN